MSVLVPEFMSSKDSDSEQAGTIIKHPIKWRSARADEFFKTLDGVKAKSQRDKQWNDIFLDPTPTAQCLLKNIQVGPLIKRSEEVHKLPEFSQLWNTESGLY